MLRGEKSAFFFFRPLLDVEVVDEAWDDI